MSRYEPSATAADRAEAATAAAAAAATRACGILALWRHRVAGTLAVGGARGWQAANARTRRRDWPCRAGVCDAGAARSRYATLVTTAARAEAATAAAAAAVARATRVVDQEGRHVGSKCRAATVTVAATAAADDVSTAAATRKRATAAAVALGRDRQVVGLRAQRDRRGTGERRRQLVPVEHGARRGLRKRVARRQHDRRRRA